MSDVVYVFLMYIDKWQWIDTDTVILSVASDESDKLDLDGQGGRKFLRVLLNLVMHNYPQLVSGALQLLFRHFSQRHEVLQAFQQVSSCFKLQLSPFTDCHIFLGISHAHQLFSLILAFFVNFQFYLCVRCGNSKHSYVALVSYIEYYAIVDSI